jgi:hypothetical protein
MEQITAAGITAAVLTADFHVAPVTLAPGAFLADLYRLMNCDTVDVVALDEGLDMWVDDEGIYRNNTSNPVASMIAHLHGRCWQPYFGTVVFSGGIDENGNALPLTDQALQRLTHLVDLAKQMPA